jgi:hypothetical protein
VLCGQRLWPTGAHRGVVDRAGRCPGPPDGPRQPLAAGQRDGQRGPGQEAGQGHAGQEDEDDGGRAEQRPPHHGVQPGPACPDQGVDEQHLGQVNAVGVIRSDAYRGPQPPRAPRLHQDYAQQVQAGDSAEVERDHTRLERVVARAQEGRDALFGQEVDGLREEGRRDGQRYDQAHVPEQPFIHRVEVERRDAPGKEVERIGRELPYPAGAEHGHDRPVHQGHEHRMAKRGDDDDSAMMIAGPPQEHHEEREHQVVLQDDEQEVQLVIPGG